MERSGNVFRNDKLDAANFFENAGGLTKESFAKINSGDRSADP